MSKKLAIKGHSTRGKEVIELLEMMGGKNRHNLNGLFSENAYYLIGGPHNDEILGGEYMFGNEDIYWFTLEEFLKKFPYKVGDKVHIYVQNDDIDGRYDIGAAEITSMRWNPTIHKIAYKMKNINREFYKEEIKCKVDDSNKQTSIMGKKLAIKGHATRGKEVIELLEMMGGENSLVVSGCKLSGYEPFNLYYINDNGVINHKYHSLIKDMVLFSLEEFLEKYPFKVGDKVVDGYGNILTIKSMSWASDYDTMVYDFEETEDVLCAEDIKVSNDNHTKISKMKNVLAELLEHIKTTSKEELDREFEEIKEWSNVGPTVEEFKTFCECINDTNKDGRLVVGESKQTSKETITPTPDITAEVTDKNNCSIGCPDGYEFYDENGNLIGTKVMMRPKKPVYPDDYEECVRIAKNIHGYDIHIDAPAYRELMELLVKLLICRDAYWKIAGEEMGLDRPWDSTYGCGEWGYWIGYDINENKICLQDSRILVNHTLVFPTKEMRDAFYENFKDLIEECKELL